MNMVVGAVGQTDVAAFKFLLNRVSCNGETVDPWSTEVVRNLNDLELNDKYVALGSGHAFADAFVVLNEGCYDVVALPLQADGSPSDICTLGVYNNAQVVDGQTTEVVLVSQCNGQQKTGAIDQLVLINQPPVIVDGWFDPDKWVCHDDVQTLCLKFFDPNKDPVDILWQQVSGVPLEQGITFLSSEQNPDGTTTECVTWKHAGPGKVEFQAVGYDLFKNPNGPGNITFESYFQSLGLQTTSHDSLDFMAYGLSNPTTCPCDPNPEVPDGMDNDCDGLVDDYEEICGNGLDDDGDGLVDENATPEICDGLDNDCDGQIDENASPEVCDGLDNDCNGLPDDGLVEVCDGLDNDCDGLVDELASCQPDDDCDGADDDGDGLIDEDTCCPAPGGEVCDGADNDCDGLVDELPTCNCDPAGLESVACNGYSQVGTYDDGSCGHYQQVIDACSAQCGAPPAGQSAGSAFCLGADKYQPVTNGSCGTTNQLVQANAPECAGPPGCTQGAFVGAFCQGMDLYNQYQNADCTTYSQLAQACSAQCGAPPAGQPVGAPYCQGYDQYQTYTNGSCGNTVQLVEANSAACGYSPCQQGGYVSSFCSGVAYYSTYTNADCTTYSQLVSPCGVLCAPPAGQPAGNWLCQGYDKYQPVADGLCGTTNQLVQSNSPDCGYAPPAACPGACYESDAGGNYQASGPYDACKIDTPDGGFDYYLCSDALGCADYPAGCSYGGHQGPPAPACQNGCYESDAAGNYQASGPYDAYKICAPGGGFDYYLCSDALGCSDYPAGCFYGGFHP